MNTRASDIIWLLDEAAPTPDPENEMRIQFKGAKPPTTFSVYLNFRGQHNHLQTVTRRQSNFKDAAKLTINELTVWWGKTGIPIKKTSSLSDMIIQLHKRWQQLHSKIKITTEAKQKGRRQFMEDLRKTFWAPSPAFEQKAKESKHSILKEEYNYLQSIKDPNHHATIGPLDNKTLNTTKSEDRKKMQFDKRIRKEKEYADSIAKVCHPLPENMESSETESVQEMEEEGYTHVNKRARRRKEIISDTLCTIADKNQVSNRALMEIMCAHTLSQGQDIDELNLSVMTVKRRRDAARNKGGLAIEEKYKERVATNDYFVLQWDGKMLNKLQHTAKSVEHIAVILKPIQTPQSDMILSITGLLGKSDAENESQCIIDELEKYNVNKSKVIALCFDTTSVNTGIHKGIITRLQHYFGKSLLLLACRHHIFELACGSSSRVVYGETSSPGEDVFGTLRDHWYDLIIDDYDVLDSTSFPRFLKSKCEETLLFCRTWLGSSGFSSLHLRKDYKELIMLAIIFLGGSIDDFVFHIQAPGAIHHARWMAKVIYSIKIAMFRTQLKDKNLIPKEKLNQITSLATFLIIYHVKAWFTCSNAADAPCNDLRLHRMLKQDSEIFEKNPEQYPVDFSNIANAYLSKFDGHL